jgi:antitoxin MazE
MVKTLSIIGNSLGLIIERPILELLHITKDTPLEITTNGESLTIRPVIVDANDKKSRVRASGKRMMSAHAATLRKLAK